MKNVRPGSLKRILIHGTIRESVPAMNNDPKNNLFMIIFSLFSMAQFCESCGAPLKEGDKFCEQCGAAVGTVQPAAAPAAPPAPPAQKEKNPLISLLLSFFFPGLGSVYNGDTVKGVAIYIGTIIGMFLFIVPGVIVWIYGMYDAYTTAKKMNEGLIPYKEANTMVIIGFIVAVLVIGAIALAFSMGL
jgi:TM2 domain-containing membrane protein YozV